MSRVMQMPPPPPLLLTKRVTAFLRANLSPHIHSAMLTSPAGSLLAHASNLPSSALRRQAAVAASLFQGPSDTPATSTTNTPAPGGSVRSRKSGKHASPSVTVHLDNGAVFVIRRLRCGMLFICMGGTEGPTASGRVTPTGPAAHHNRRNTTDAHPPQDDDQDTPLSPTTTITASTTARSSRPSTPPAPFAPSATTPSILTTPPPNPAPRSIQQPPSTSIPTPGPSSAAATTPSPTSTPQPQQQQHQQQQQPPNSPSQASILSSHTTGAASTTTSSTSATATTPTAAAASLMRRQVDELARWLDERLGGLSVPEEGIGLGGGNIELAVR